MLFLTITGILGYFFGWLLKSSLFAKKRGVGWIGALASFGLSFFVTVLGFSMYAEIELGASAQPVWVGQAAGYFSAGLLFGIKRRKSLEEKEG